jgi:hypothetical protein
MVNAKPRALYSWHPKYRGQGEPQGRSGQVRKISPPTGIRSPDRPARSQSLYRLHPCICLSKDPITSGEKKKSQE